MVPADPFGGVPVFAELPAQEQDELIGKRELGAPTTAAPEPLRRMGGLNLNPFAARPYSTKEAVVLPIRVIA
jgi:hypothetical protein